MQAFFFFRLYYPSGNRVALYGQVVTVLPCLW